MQQGEHGRVWAEISVMGSKCRANVDYIDRSWLQRESRVAELISTILVRMDCLILRRIGSIEQQKQARSEVEIRIGIPNGEIEFRFGGKGS